MAKDWGWVRGGSKLNFQWGQKNEKIKEAYLVKKKKKVGPLIKGCECRNAFFSQPFFKSG